MFGFMQRAQAAAEAIGELPPAPLRELDDLRERAYVATALMLHRAGDYWDDRVAAADGDRITERAVIADIAVLFGVSRVNARQMVTTVHVLAHLPETDAAFTRGEIDYPKVRTICAVLDDASNQTCRLLDATVLSAARQLTPGPLRDAVWAAWLNAVPEEAERVRQEHRVTDRTVYTRKGENGMAWLSACLTDLEGAEAAKLIDELAAGVCAEDPRTPNTRRADALMALLHGEGFLRCECADPDCPLATAAPPPRRAHLLQILVDIETLLGLSANPAQLPDGTPIAPEVARTLATDATWQAILVEMRAAAQHYHPPPARAPAHTAESEARTSDPTAHPEHDETSPDTTGTAEPDTRRPGAAGSDTVPSDTTVPETPVPNPASADAATSETAAETAPAITTPDKPTPDRAGPDTAGSGKRTSDAAGSGKRTSDTTAPDKPTPDADAPDKPTPDAAAPDKPTPDADAPDKPTSDTTGSDKPTSDADGSDTAAPATDEADAAVSDTAGADSVARLECGRDEAATPPEVPDPVPPTEPGGFAARVAAGEPCPGIAVALLDAPDSIAYTDPDTGYVPILLTSDFVVTTPTPAELTDTSALAGPAYLAAGRARPGTVVPTPTRPPAPIPPPVGVVATPYDRLCLYLTMTGFPGPDDGHGGHTSPPPGAATYRPSRRLATLVRAMWPTCVFPYCTVPADKCELDHRVAFDHTDPNRGGWTVPGNLHPLCKPHHDIKSHGHWNYRPVPGGLVWTNGTGIVCLVTPTATRAAGFPTPDPAPPPPPRLLPADPALSEPESEDLLYEPTWWETHMGEDAPPPAPQDTDLRARYREHRAVTTRRTKTWSDNLSPPF